MSANHRLSLLAAAIAAVALTPAHADLNSGLVAHYTFAGSADDTSGNANHGVVNGAVLTTGRAGDAGGAYAFSGENDEIEVADSDSLDATDAVTLSAWINPAEQRTQYILTKGTHVNGDSAAPYGLSTSATGDLIFSIRPDGAMTQVRSSGYSLNEWTHLVGTFDGATANLYVNGVLADSVAVTGSLSATALPLIIGTRLGLASDTVNGSLDDLRIYNRALTAAEVGELHALSDASPMACAVTQADVDAAYADGLAACTSATTPGGDPETGYSQSELDAQVSAAVDACVADPASCGIEPVAASTGFTQADIDQAVAEAVAGCVAAPTSCGIDPATSPGHDTTSYPTTYPTYGTENASQLYFYRDDQRLNANIYIPYLTVDGATDQAYWVQLEASPFRVGDMRFEVTGYGLIEPLSNSMGYTY